MSVDLEPYIALCREAFARSEDDPDESPGRYRLEAVAAIRARVEADGEGAAVIAAVGERLLEIAGLPKVVGGNGSAPRHSSRTSKADFFYVVANLLLDRPIR